MRVLVVDIGGNNIKLAVPGRQAVVKIPSGRNMTALQMVTSVRRATSGWDFDVVSVGYPGPVTDGVPSVEPVNLGKGWVGFDYEGAFERPVRFINDAAMQALGSYEGGRMLFLGLGTGLGTALVVDGTVLPLELAHLPYRKGRTYEQCVGKAGLDLFGRRRWRVLVADVTKLLKHALQADYVVLGGGNVKELRALPDGARKGANANAMLGGVRLWEAPAWATPAVHVLAGSRAAARKAGRSAAKRAGAATSASAKRAATTPTAPRRVRTTQGTGTSIARKRRARKASAPKAAGRKPVTVARVRAKRTATKTQVPRKRVATKTSIVKPVAAKRVRTKRVATKAGIVKPAAARRRRRA